MQRDEKMAEAKKKEKNGFWGLFRTQSSATKGRKLVCAPVPGT